MRKEKHSIDVYVCEKCGKEFAHESACKEHEAGCHKVVLYTAILTDLLLDGDESVIDLKTPVTISVDYPVAREILNDNPVSAKSIRFDMYFDVGKYSPDGAYYIFTNALLKWETKRHDGFLKALSSVCWCPENKNSK